MRKAYEIARDNLGCRAERAKKGYDMRVRPTRYEVGQWVYYYCPRRFVRRSPKWQKMYTGPFLIVKKIGPVNVKLQATKRSLPFISHIDKLKHCLGPTPISWLETENTTGGTEDVVDLQHSEPLLLEDELAEVMEQEQQDPPGLQWTGETLYESPNNSRPVRDRKQPVYLKDYVQ